MFDLVYPLEPADIVGVKSIPATSEVLPIVEPTGLVIGRSTRKACHGHSRLLHPVVHLHIINRNGQILLQKRSKSKDLLPGFWDTAVGGHVSYGEQLDEALFREAYEELAFRDFNPIMLRHYIFENDYEMELVAVYATIFGGLGNISNDEVSEVRYWSEAELDAAMGKGLLTPSFEQEYMQIREGLMALL